MKLYDELVARGLIAQVTNESEIREMVNAGKAMMEGVVEDVRKWTAETPELYTLLLCVEGEYTRFNVGFRRFEIQGDIFLVNGQPVKFKGVNLHETDPYTGHYGTRERMLQDIRIMKENNILVCYFVNY